MLRKQSLVFSFCLPDHFSKLTLELPGLGILSFSFASRWTASSAAQRYEVELAKTSSLEHVEHAWQRWFLPKVEIILAILLSPKLSSRGYVPWRASFGLRSNIPIASWNVWPWPKIKGEKRNQLALGFGDSEMCQLWEIDTFCCQKHWVLYDICLRELVWAKNLKWQLLLIGTLNIGKKNVKKLKEDIDHLKWVPNHVPQKRPLFSHESIWILNKCFIYKAISKWLSADDILTL